MLLHLVLRICRKKKRGEKERKKKEKKVRKREKEVKKKETEKRKRRIGCVARERAPILL